MSETVSRRTLLGAIPAAAALGVLATPNASAAAPPLSIGVQPVEGGNARFLTLTPKTASDPATAKLVLRLALTNGGPQAVTVTGIEFAFPGLPKVVMQGPDIVMGNDGVIQPGQLRYWSNGKVKLPNDTTVDNAVYLNVPAPGSVKITVKCAGFADPATITLPLSAYQCPDPGGYALPFAIGDMRPGEMLSGAGSHWANGGAQGSQIYAHDVGVVGWDANAWRDVLPGKDGSKNEHYRIWNKPVRAVAAGVVHDVHDGMPDNTQTGQFPDPTPSPVAGNHVWVRHGTEVILYPHLRNGTVAVQAGDTVAAGEILGRAGNSGNSTNPHIHLEVRRDIATWPLRPLALDRTWLVARSANTPFNPDSNSWVRTLGRGIPKESSLLWPASTRPAWYPPWRREVTVVAVPAAQYQTTFDRVTGSGYRPVWVDGYEVGGATFFNAIFRPADTTWSARHGMTGAGYQQEFDDHKAAGFRLAHVTNYLVGGLVRYAAIWVKQADPAQAAYHGLATANHQDQFDTLTADGYVPLNISVVSVANQLSFTGLYAKTNIGSFHAPSVLTADQYQQAWNDNSAAGRHLMYLNAYQHAGSMRFSAIFAAQAPGSGGTVGRHHLTTAEYVDAADPLVENNTYLTRVVAGYERGGAGQFGVSWRRP